MSKETARLTSLHSEVEITQKKNRWLTSKISAHHTHQGRAQKFEKGGRNFRRSIYRPKFSKDQKNKGRHVFWCPIYRPKSSEDRKKIITPFDVRFTARNQVKTKKKRSARPQQLIFQRPWIRLCPLPPKPTKNLIFASLQRLSVTQVWVTETAKELLWNMARL